jgi:2-iminobutanoate/2-iminopropanoate deaminase
VNDNMDIVTAKTAPKAVGPYSHAIRVGGGAGPDWIFTSGQVGLDPQSGKIVPGGVVEETRQVLRNLSAVLEAAGSGLPRVVKTTVFLADLGDFAAMNAVYAEAFGGHRPTRSTVQAAALPLGARVEIDAVALA